jgi:hypothetical protein
MPQVLNETQRVFVEETIRPFLETLVLFKLDTDQFILDYDNQQMPIIEDAEVLWDNAQHDGPREGVPQLTGQRLGQMRTVIGNMNAQLDGMTLDILVSLLARGLIVTPRS